MTVRPEARSTIVKRSLLVRGHPTSISLEDAFWSGLKSIAAERGRSVAAVVAEIDEARQGANLSSAIRVFVFEHAIEELANARAARDDVVKSDTTRPL